MNQPTQTQSAQAAPKMMAVPEHLLVSAINIINNMATGTPAQLNPTLFGLQACQPVPPVAETPAEVKEAETPGIIPSDAQ